jgi:hypothetical protein
MHESALSRGLRRRVESPDKTTGGKDRRRYASGEACLALVLAGSEKKK